MSPSREALVVADQLVAPPPQELPQVSSPIRNSSLMLPTASTASLDPALTPIEGRPYLPASDRHVFASPHPEGRDGGSLRQSTAGSCHSARLASVGMPATQGPSKPWMSSPPSTSHQYSPVLSMPLPGVHVRGTSTARPHVPGVQGAPSAHSLHPMPGPWMPRSASALSVNGAAVPGTLGQPRR